ncbi:XRE family transcriptional regulator [Achromobacter sp.]|uniref:helix-turn-helix domain-containing protein n=1 Tax=Achromobacter sp. TaxID=134375 RepID=UPI0028991F88|nr:XRE family transcriptional regulator [Achromobacter sp.]
MSDESRVVGAQRLLFSSVWDAIENTPMEAESMKLRSGLMMTLTNHVKQSGITQMQAARLFGVTQPRVTDLLRGRINLFKLDVLVNMVLASKPTSPPPTSPTHP